MESAERQNLAPPRAPGCRTSGPSGRLFIELTARAGTARRVEARSLLFNDGERRDHLLVLEQGWAYAYRTLSDGRRHVSEVYVPGDVIGLGEAWTGAGGPAVCTLTEVLAAPIGHDALTALVRRSPDAAVGLATALADIADTLSLRSASLARHTAYERVAYLLWSLRARTRPIDGDGLGAFTCPVPQSVMADALGISAVHMNRSLGQLARDGVLRKRTLEVEILDNDALDRIVRA